jgi:tetratricopeptide (TPR) repeat protein
MAGGVTRLLDGSDDLQPFKAYFEALLKSAAFQASPRRCELLRYLVDVSISGQGSKLSEYAIALDVFRKPESFDQRIDSTVRSEVSRLRKTVSSYYAGAGAQDPWRIVFPARGYVPEVSRVVPEISTVEQEQDSPSSEQASSPRQIPSRAVGLASIALVVAVAVVAIFIRFRPHGIFENSRPENLSAATEAHHAAAPNPAARALYLKGQYYWEHRTEGSLNEAVDAYTQAIVADSEYAEAYAGLAASYDLMPEYASMPQKDAFSRAIAAANKAISLDRSISIAHRALAFGLFWSQTDIPRAFSEFQEAVRLAPNDAEAHHWYATALNAVSRLPEAQKEIDIAQQLSPASRSILVDNAWIRFVAGDPQAVAKLRELEAAEPDFRSPPEFLARIALARGEYADYIEQLRRIAAISKNPADLEFSESARKGWDDGGSVGMLRAMKAIQERAYVRNQSDGYDLARTCALLGEKQQAVKYLEAAFAAKDMFLPDALRADWAPQLNGYPPFENFRAQIRSRFGISRT